MLQRLGFPAVGDHRRFVTALAIDAVGSGVFMPVSMLYFLVTTDLTLVQVGGAISLASLVALPAGPLIGSVVDRIGAKRVLLAGNVLQAVGFAAYLVSDSFAVVTLWTVVVTLGRTAFWGSFGNIVTAISAPGEREKWFGFLGALRNVGFAVGGLAAGVAITVGTPGAYATVVVANAASYAVALALLLAVPATHSGTAVRAEPGSWALVLADRPYRVLFLAQLAYSTSMMALNFAMPVYATEVLGLAGWVTGAIFTLNTIMVGFGQGLVVRGLTGRVRWRVLMSANATFAASFVVLLGASRLSAVLATVVVLVGSVVYTLGELVGGPVHGALSAEAAPEHLRGRYLSLIQLAWNGSGAAAPVGIAWLLDRGPEPVWAAFVAVAVAGMLFAARLGTVMPRAAQRVTNRVEDPLPA
ncbi:MFS transporter [Nocardioides sp. cx-173]|uniref:MFS transporter n=1 Tax=Nocardioides sp. cx-173 TaxID=2898796 RepID=UPI001E3E9B52|nr:MFS transporter [Nocardioides sp. cx-173]MCD4524964.1 MFS transporter [Nocardioides sp. cx-173]UGB43462.1 MFS transporter [Nocardioides sp. cx-173]